MEEILPHLGCMKPCKIMGKTNYLSTGAGFLPSKYEGAFLSEQRCGDSR